MADVEVFDQFEGEIRKVWDDPTGDWWFAVVDVIAVLTHSANPAVYWRQMKKREPELVTNCNGFPIRHKKNNRIYQTDCANQQGILRIIQSIPSPNAEPFKLWLAEVGRDRIEETADPSLAIERAMEIYLQRGYSDAWIKKRLSGRKVRSTLLAHWSETGVEDEAFHELLDIISEETFGVKLDEYRQIKGLSHQVLEDHMTDVELALSIAGEVFTREIALTSGAAGVEENKKAAYQGGKIAGDSRKQLEKQTGKSAVSSINYLEEPEKEVRKRLEK